MATNYKAEISKLMESANLFYSLFNYPTNKPHRVCVSDDNSMKGNAWGKLVIEGKTWREVYDILKGLAITPELIAGNKLHEVPDNMYGKLVVISNIEYDTEDDWNGGDVEAQIAELPKNIIAVIPPKVRTQEDADTFLSDHISAKTGWCHLGFSVVPELTSIYRK